MRRSKKQRKAAQQNGAKSQGPVTIEGKQKSAQNALSHGLTAQTVCLHFEDREAYNQIQNAMIKRFQPADDTELLTIEELTVLTWKLRRCWSIQTALDELQLSEDQAYISKNFHKVDDPTRMAIAEKGHAKNKEIENMRRHEDRISRQITRTTNRLLKLQKDRREAEERNPQPPENTPEKPVNENIQNEPEHDTQIHLVTLPTEPQQDQITEKETDTCTGPVETQPDMS